MMTGTRLPKNYIYKLPINRPWRPDVIYTLYTSLYTGGWKGLSFLAVCSIQLLKLNFNLAALLELTVHTWYEGARAAWSLTYAGC